MNFLIDTNILISAEPTRSEDVEHRTPVTAQLLGAISQGQHGVFVHPASVDEVAGDKDPLRRGTRLVLLDKYPKLQFPPGLHSRLTTALGAPPPRSHHEVDMLLLSAVEADAVDYFVTEDERLHKRASRAGLASRVLYAADALATIRGLFPSIPTPPPHVRAILAHALRDDEIFSSLRRDYTTFDAWLTKCKREQRRVWVIETGQSYAGLCIVNDENLPNTPGKTLKLCTFKVSDSYRGLRYGELLLKAVFQYLTENAYSATFVEVFPKHEYLMRLFGEFGFSLFETKSNGELVMRKVFQAPPDAPALTPLEYNVLYGPHRLTMAAADVFVVPIQPRFHQLLFPESETQLQLRTELHPFSNSIRKAYLSHAVQRQLKAGDVLLFYCSQVAQAVMAVGVVEGTVVSDKAAELARYVGKRTVYPYVEIERMATRRVLAILFRLSRFVAGGWPLDLLVRTGIVRAAPQSIVRVRSPEALAWIAKELDVPR